MSVNELPDLADVPTTSLNGQEPEETGGNVSGESEAGEQRGGTHLASVILMDSACHNTEATW